MVFVWRSAVVRLVYCDLVQSQCARQLHRYININLASNRNGEKLPVNVPRVVYCSVREFAVINPCRFLLPIHSAVTHSVVTCRPLVELERITPFVLQCSQIRMQLNQIELFVKSFQNLVVFVRCRQRCFNYFIVIIPHRISLIKVRVCVFLPSLPVIVRNVKVHAYHCVNRQCFQRVEIIIEKLQIPVQLLTEKHLSVFP